MSEMGMVEKVARAIYAKTNHITPDRLAEIADGWKLYELEARAAIEAMREPSEAMCREGSELAQAHSVYQEEMDEDAKDVWHAMIDAALAR